MEIETIRVAWLQIFNPPLLGITAGVAVGLSPAGGPLFLTTARQKLPIELQAFLGVLCLLAKVMIKKMVSPQGVHLSLISLRLKSKLWKQKS